MNARAIEHEGAMVDVYSKMKPDSFTLQLQTIITALYEDIKGVVSASGCTKSKVVKCKFEDQTCARVDANAADAAADADDDDDDATASPATSPGGGVAAPPGGEGPASAPSPGCAGAGAGGGGQ